MPVPLDSAWLISGLLALATFGSVAALVGAFQGPQARRHRRLHRRMQTIGLRAAGTGSATPAISLRRQEGEGSAIEKAANLLLPRPGLLKQRLVRTGWRITLGQYASACLAMMLAGTLAALVFGLPPGLALLVGLPVGIGLPYKLIGFAARRRAAKFLDQFPDAIDLIVRSVKSGLPVGEAITAAGSEIGDPLGQEFRAVADEVRVGLSLEEALWSAAGRLDLAEFNFFVVSLVVQRETGGNLAETLGNLSDILRRRRQMKLKVKAMSSEARASAYILGSLPFIMIALLSVVNADYTMLLFTDPRGLMMVGFGLLMLMVGIAVMMKMVRFDI